MKEKIIDWSILPKVECNPDSKDDVISYYKILLRRLKKKLSDSNHCIYRQAKFIRDMKHQRRRNRKEIHKLRTSIKETLKMVN